MVKNAQAATQSAAAVGSGVTFIASIINYSSPAAVWSMASQLQFCMLLLLTGAFLPPDVSDYLAGTTFSAFSFDFVPVMEIPYYGYPARLLDIEQDDLNLRTIGIESGSSLSNNFPFLTLLVLLIVLALINKCIPWVKKRNNPTKTRKCGR